jgi:hypothetical protein
MGSWYTRVLMALILLALVANLATGGELMAEGKWEWVFAGGGSIFGVVVHVLGIRYVSRIRAKRERTSLLWARRGFAVGLVLILLVIADTFFGNEENQVVKEMWKGGALLFILSAAPFFFLLGYARDAARLVARTGAGSRRRSSSRSDAG